MPLSARNRADDFDAIAFVDAFFVEGGAAHYPIVLCNRDPAIRRLQSHKQLSYRQTVRELELLAVDGSLHGVANLPIANASDTALTPSTASASKHAVAGASRMPLR